MKAKPVCFISLLLFTLIAVSPVYPLPLSQRSSNYTIDVRLNTEKKSLDGEEVLVWRNPSRMPVCELQFHLYLNAFKDMESSYLKEYKPEPTRNKDNNSWGSIAITSIKTSDSTDLSSAMHFIQPDDGNVNDQTVMAVTLKRPVPPGGFLSLRIHFTARLPQVIARTGYYRDFFMVAQWFPKIGVYELPGQGSAKTPGWNCHQFHANTEFYADFGVYDVTITLPKQYITGATGALQSTRENPDGTKSVRYRAEDVHDFAWTASPRFVEVTDTWRHVLITVLMQPQRLHQTDRYLKTVKHALEYLDTRVGMYPYTTLTIVDPAYGAMNCAGMEYPTLVTAGSLWGLGPQVKFAEMVTVHEFLHQYWYGMVASNEFEEAWLDEGITQYYETRIIDELFGTKTSFLNVAGFHAGDLEESRTGYTGMKNPKVNTTAATSWSMQTGAYGQLVYFKPAVFLATLERMIGKAAMDSAMRTYFSRWKFKHPASNDFVSIVNEVVAKIHGRRFGKNLNWYFDQVLYGTDICDYELTSLTNTRAVSRHDSSGSRIAPDSAEHVCYDSKVIVSRLGEVILPMTILVCFENGDSLRIPWDGASRTRELAYHREWKIVTAVVDPEMIYLLDVNLNNNSRTIEPSTMALWKYAVKFLFWIQNILSAAAIFS
jgi:hypothetical protein